MHVSVETNGLERRMTVEVPAESIDLEVRSRLKSLASSARLDGFRPGKVPFTVVERKFAGRVRSEVLGDTIRTSYEEALRQEKLNPVAGPKIETLYEQPDKGLGYTATFEVYPEIALTPLDALNFIRPAATINEQDVDNMLTTLRKQSQTWAPVERAARLDDQVQIEFRAELEGETSSGSHSQQTSAVLGMNAIPKEIEDSLLGVKPGEEVIVNHQVPADFPDPARTGKSVTYTVKLITLYEPVLPAMDAQFARNLGVDSGSLDELRIEVRANMERELSQAIALKLKQQVMDALLEANPMEVPKTLVDKEAQMLLAQTREKFVAQGRKAHELPADSSLFESSAQRRVILGLLIGDVIRTSSMKADPARVRIAIETIAFTYEDPEEIIKWYYGSPERLAQVQSLVLEDQVVEWVLEQAQVTVSNSTFDKLMNPQQNAAA